MTAYYDDIWVYGLKSIYNPLHGLDVPQSTKSRMHWTGYLRRETWDYTPNPNEEPYILVTPGGGGDGEKLVDQVLRAYEADSELSPKANIIYGPFLSGERREQFENRVAKLKGRVVSLGFNSKMENLIAGATGVIAMGGYNTFCEILSFDKPAIIMPRKRPRLEQHIRASRAEQLKLVRMLDPDRDGLGTSVMVEAIRALPDQSPPSVGQFPDLLNGLPSIVDRVFDLLKPKGTQAAE